MLLKMENWKLANIEIVLFDLLNINATYYSLIIHYVNINLKMVVNTISQNREKVRLVKYIIIVRVY